MLSQPERNSDTGRLGLQETVDICSLSYDIGRMLCCSSYELIEIPDRRINQSLGLSWASRE